MTRRCSHCSHNGHNSRTCPGRAGGGGVRLFGVRLTEGVGSMKKSASMGCLSSAAAHLGSSAAASPGSPSAAAAAASGYASDDAAHASCSANCRTERKKGTPWTEEEHRMFLLGLQKLGKGDWRGIARNYVVSRTPTQVASHAQKYFIRQTNATRRKRRASLFDMVPEMPVDEVPALEEQTFMLLPSPAECENMNQFPSLGLSQDQESEPVEASSKESPLELAENVQSNNQPLPIPMVPTFYPTFIPVPLPFWPPQKLNTPVEEEMRATHEVLKPTPVLPKEPISVDEVVRMSRLSIGEGGATSMEPSALSLKLLGASTSRQSAFHLNPSIAGPDLSQSKSNAIHAN